MGQKITTTQFYLYGKKHFTQTGWRNALQRCPPEGGLLGATTDLTGHTFVVTGANSGIGKELAQFLSSKKAKVYMVCRNRERAEKARDEIAAENGEGAGPLEIVVSDVATKAGVEGVVKSLANEDKLDGLVCNAGALSDKVKLTEDGVETTFGCHLLFGSYLLAKLAKPLLDKAKEPRVIFVSSGGMYNTKFPAWDVVTATKPGLKFNGQLAYAYCKRGQVLLAERLTEQHAGTSPIKYVSCHPGWVDTPGVDAAYGSQKKYLEPMRTPWQGTDGIAWLCIAPGDKVKGGEFYLDREPQTKHLSGYFMSEGKFTKNTAEEVDQMMANLEAWADKPVPHPDAQPDGAAAAAPAAQAK
mmetsp:Transcript_35403/g.92639  ORF Transcript_35403/g.92639 Transcript_35403/m.92639 type:complete len:356 (+) Transcript_35403:91-1158(+)